MKRKFVLLILSLLCLCACAIGLTACGKSSGLIYTPDNDGTGYAVYYCRDKTIETVIIPAEHDGKPVTSIYSGAFDGCTSLKSVTIPNSVTSIGGYAFNGCTSLTSVTIGNSVTSIGSDAFRGCTALTNITIPDSVTSIEFQAFYNCPIETATIPAVACDAVGNPKLKTVVITNGETISGFSGCSSLENLTLPDSVTSIGYSAFEDCTGLKELTFLEKDCAITSIGECAFRNCTQLSTVTIPESVTYVGSDAFEGCEKLWTVNWDAEDASAGSGVFKDCCTAINDWNGMVLNIGKKVKKIPAAFNEANIFRINFLTGSICTEIEDNAFKDCKQLTVINLPDSLKTIGSNAFSGCVSLFELHLPKNLNAIGNNAFDGCEKLIEVYSASQMAIEKGSSSNGKVAYYADNVYNPTTGGTKLSYWNDYAFYYNGNNYYLMGSSSIYCSTLDDEISLNLPNAVYQYGVKISEYYKLYDYALAYRNDNSVYIPAAVTEIGKNALTGLSKLKSIEAAANSSVCASQDGILYNKAKTEILLLPSHLSGEITLTNGLTTIPNNAFRNCTELTGITIPDSVTKIGDYAFYGCSSLTSITIPDSVTKIGSGAFRDCTSITSITFEGTVAQWNAIEKSSYWNSNTGDYTIYCTDGEIAKDGTVTMY